MNELGSLSQCMMDGDLEGLGRARSIRRKALLASSALELTLLAALLLWPLITPGVLSSRVAIMPWPPFHGMPQTQQSPQRTNEAPPPQNTSIRFPVDLPPARRIPPSNSVTNDAELPGAY